MPRFALARLAALALSTTALACATSPTGRSQLMLVSDEQMMQLGVQAYDQLKTQTPTSTDTSVNNYVRCIANAITGNLSGEQNRFAAGGVWEVNVFDDDSANAFALPGGKIGVHTGLLKVAQNQHQLAAVIGHEVAHVLARHSSERASAQQGLQLGLGATSMVLGGMAPGTQQTWMAVLGAGGQLGILKYSRAHESEADVYGLELMARAGFDPSASIPLWENMAAAAGGAAPPEFVSTHPSHATRIRDLGATIPKWRPEYQRVRASGRAPQCGP